MDDSRVSTSQVPASWREKASRRLVEGFSTAEDILERGEFIDEEVIGEIELLESVDDVRLPEAPKEESVHLSKKIGDDNTSMSD